MNALGLHDTSVKTITFNPEWLDFKTRWSW